MQLVVITLRQPASDLSYLVTGVQKTGKGRKKLYAGKVNVKKIDKRRWKKCFEYDLMPGYELKAFCIAMKRVVKVVYLDFKNRDGYTILLSTDMTWKEKVICYYQLCFQIEFLVRDAKQHTGLKECHVRS